MKNETTIEILNTLTIINNDRIEGYETASSETEEADLKTLFDQFISTSKKCKTDLASEIDALGGDKAEGTKTTGKFFQKWMDVKAAISSKDRKSLLHS